MTRVVLETIGTIESSRPATAVVFEPSEGSSAPANLIQVQAEDLAKGLAFHLRIPFTGTNLSRRESIPGEVVDPRGEGQRVELGLRKGLVAFLADSAVITIQLLDNRIVGRFEKARMVPSGNRGIALVITGSFDAALELTCWTRAGKDSPVATNAAPAYRLDVRRRSSFCTTLRLTQSSR